MNVYRSFFSLLLILACFPARGAAGARDTSRSAEDTKNMLGYLTARVREFLAKQHQLGQYDFEIEQAKLKLILTEKALNNGELKLVAQNLLQLNKYSNATPEIREAELKCIIHSLPLP